MSVNLKSVFFSCQEVGRQMAKQGRGKIINVASLTSMIGLANVSIYGASKGGVAQLTKALAVEWAPHHINVNAVLPGYYKTALTEDLFKNEERAKWVLSRIPVHEKLVLMERSLALAMDLAAALAIGTGFGLAFNQTPNIFARPGAGWFHIKLTIVVLGVLSVHGMIRARVGKFSRGQTPTVPQWMWSLLLVAITGIVIMVFRGPLMFAKG